jgi:DNA helicase-2/ATP-dependent DNA helicase PcrA
MKSTHVTSPAEIAAKEALEKVYSCIRRSKSFVLEAGAGAGKTYTLIQTLKQILENKGETLLRNKQRIACITYTNVAREEIESRTDHHPAIYTATIHSFCWSLIKDFQPRLRELITHLDKWPKRLEHINSVNSYTITYDLGIPGVQDNQILLGHNDVISLAIFMIEDLKFRRILVNRYPIIFIDEYQDTDKKFVESLKRHFLDSENGPLLGFFGDHWQKIYPTGCGKIEHENLEVIGKRANFRSSTKIVECLNRIRPDLTQEVSDTNNVGGVIVFHTNEWGGIRRTDGHWKDDLPPDIAHQFIERTKSMLVNDGWDFAPDKTKILMLTHNILAQEQGYRNLANVFPRSEIYIKKEDPYIAFFADTLEPFCTAYENRKYGEMSRFLGTNYPLIRSHKDKEYLARYMEKLLTLRSNGTVGMVIEHLTKGAYPPLTESIIQIEEICSKKDELELTENQRELLERTEKLKKISYQEVVALVKFIEDKTPFATKHGVKGAEFENVLVIFGRGWNLYNFSQMLEYAYNGVPTNKMESFERNRNLFYIACSRPKSKLALLFTQKLSNTALRTLEVWFGANSLISLY